jgi:hypothetical protein
MVTDNTAPEEKKGPEPERGTPQHPDFIQDCMDGKVDGMPSMEKVMDDLDKHGGDPFSMLAGGLFGGGGGLGDIMEKLEMVMRQSQSDQDLKAAMITICAMVIASGGRISVSEIEVKEARELWEARAMDKTEGDDLVSWNINREKLDEYRASKKEAGPSKETESGSGGSPKATDETTQG